MTSHHNPFTKDCVPKSTKLDKQINICLDKINYISIEYLSPSSLRLSVFGCTKHFLTKELSCFCYRTSLSRWNETFSINDWADKCWICRCFASSLEETLSFRYHIWFANEDNRTQKTKPWPKTYGWHTRVSDTHRNPSFHDSINTWFCKICANSLLPLFNSHNKCKINHLPLFLRDSLCGICISQLLVNY